MEPDQIDEAFCASRAMFYKVFSRGIRVTRNNEVKEVPLDELRPAVNKRVNAVDCRLRELFSLVEAEARWWRTRGGVVYLGHFKRHYRRKTFLTANSVANSLQNAFQDIWGIQLDGAEVCSQMFFLAIFGEAWRHDVYYDIAKCFHKSPKHGRDPVEQRKRALQLRDEIETILFPV
jgi:hypothetical protein